MTPRKQPAVGVPTLVVEARRVEDLKPDPDNARLHGTVNIDAIAASLREFGQRKPLVIDKRNVLVAGSGTLRAMQQEGWEWADVVVYPGTRAQARAYAIADNRTGELATWDNQQLLDTLRVMPDRLVTAAGFSDELLDELAAELSIGLGGIGGGDDAEPDKGELLALAATTVGEPDYTVHRGEVWGMGTHTLVVADVHTGWPQWAELLDDDMLFWPYPSLLAPFTMAAEQRPVLFVQPNLYLAGWLLTKWARLSGRDPIREGK